LENGSKYFEEAALDPTVLEESGDGTESVHSETSDFEVYTFLDKYFFPNKTLKLLTACRSLLEWPKELNKD
jgi:hypothetical protein